MKTIDEQQTFIVENLDILAAVSWKGYLSKGRGAVSIAVDDSLPPPPGVPVGTATGLRLGYVPVAEFPSQTNNEKTAIGMCERYEPKTQIVVVVAYLENGRETSDHHRLRARLPPPEAYKKYKKRLKRKHLQDQWWDN